MSDTVYYLCMGWMGIGVMIIKTEMFRLYMQGEDCHFSAAKILIIIPLWPLFIIWLTFKD